MPKAAPWQIRKHAQQKEDMRSRHDGREKLTHTLKWCREVKRGDELEGVVCVCLPLGGRGSFEKTVHSHPSWMQDLLPQKRAKQWGGLRSLRGRFTHTRRGCKLFLPQRLPVPGGDRLPLCQGMSSSLPWDGGGNGSTLW